jgi:hypothetical protein
MDVIRLAEERRAALMRFPVGGYATAIGEILQ